MSDPAEEVKRVKCPKCRREVFIQRDGNGVGRRTGPFRYVSHGGGYGRWCKNSGELTEANTVEVVRDE